MAWKREEQQGNESMKCLWDLPQYTRGFGYDIGCGPAKAYSHMIGIDNRKDTAMFGIPMEPDLTVPDATNLSILADDKADFVYSSHMLEHVVDYKGALKEWWRLIKVGGYMTLYLPHKDFYPNIGKEGANPDHKHDFMPKDIIRAMKEIGTWDLVECQERNGEGCDGRGEYSFLVVFQKAKEGHKQSWKNQKPKKTAALVRYGAFGDIIQTASIAAALKSQGYHVTFYCETRGHEVAKSDANFDKFYIQDKDQVPNLRLGDFWNWEKRKYDKWVNLSESVEGSLLALPDRAPSMWPQPMRHKYMNHNYLEFMHDIAGTQYQWFKDGQRFHATEDELRWANEEKAKNPGITILWALAGSSIHKVWPFIDIAFARLLEATDAVIYTSGDATTKKLEAGWENEPRMKLRAGEWTIRQTLAFAQVADLVVGPETGVLNAVAYDKNVAKIVLLSHSSVENLTRDWYKTISLIPMNTSCYPCHRMHYNWDNCRREEEGVASCQKDISPDTMWTALCQFIGEEHFTNKERRVEWKAVKEA